MSSNWTFVTVAYALVWIGIGGYWLHVHRVLKVARTRYEQANAKQEGARK
jgi:hypothetical protein